MATGGKSVVSAGREDAMSDWLKLFGEMSLDNLFVIAGLAFLAIGVIGKISGKINPTPRTRAISTLVGVCLVVSGVWIHHGHSEVPARTHDIGTSSAANEVHAQEVVPDRQVAATHSLGTHHAVGLSYFGGKWKNADTKTRGLTALNIRTTGESVWVHAWGACHPSDCDWGEVAGTPLSPGVSSNPTNDAEKVTAVFETSFSNTVLTLSPSEADELQADTQTRFTDRSGRSGYSATYTFRH
jgi:hypothetical protein